jgi:putative transposase
MPRTARASIGGICYHVINRGNGKAKVFQKPEDYEVFVALIADACEHVNTRVLAYCLMPNHFHLVLWPRADGDLSRWMQWLMTAHVRRYHSHYGTSGHVWQGRFKAFPIQQDEHLLTVLRYVERNALRAGLSDRAEAWAWSSAKWARDRRHRPTFMHDGPIDRGRRWLADVNNPMTTEEEDALRRCVNRGTPWGTPTWQERVADKLGIEASLHPRGRPPQPKKNDEKAEK